MTTGRLGAVSAVAVVLFLLGGCAQPGTQVADEAAPEQSASGLPTDGAAPVPTPTWADGDRPPNHVDNNAWKQRSELTAADRKLADAAAARIRPALEVQRATGDISPGTTRATLLGLGFLADGVQISGMNDPTVPGAAYGVKVGERGCVIGDVRPAEVRLEVTGSAAEFGCLEPFSH